jgi:hypothetical protein
MAYRALTAILVLGVVTVGIGCGGTDDESVFVPTPTQGPPTPTPLPICQGLDVPTGGLGCRAFTWTQPENSTESGTQLFTTLPTASGEAFDFLPSLIADTGIDPGPNFDTLPPGLALLAGVPDPVSGEAAVTVGVTEENQIVPGYVIIGIKPFLDYICLKIELATVEGTLFCNEGSSPGVDTRITAATGITPTEDDEIEFRLGDTAPQGSLFLKVIQQQGRIAQSSDPRYASCLTLPECAPGERVDCYRPAQEVAFTTGTVFGMKGNTPLLSAAGEEGFAGEPFDCDNWTLVDGPGQLVQGLADNDSLAPPPSDVATALRIDD